MVAAPQIVAVNTPHGTPTIDPAQFPHIFERIILQCTRPRPRPGTLHRWRNLHQQDLASLMRVNVALNHLTAKHLYNTIVCDSPGLLAYGLEASQTLSTRQTPSKRDNLARVRRIYVETDDALRGYAEKSREALDSIEEFAAVFQAEANGDGFIPLTAAQFARIDQAGRDQNVALARLHQRHAVQEREYERLNDAIRAASPFQNLVSIALGAYGSGDDERYLATRTEQRPVNDDDARVEEFVRLARPKHVCWRQEHSARTKGYATSIKLLSLPEGTQANYHAPLCLERMASGVHLPGVGRLVGDATGEHVIHLAGGTSGNGGAATMHQSLVRSALSARRIAIAALPPGEPAATPAAVRVTWVLGPDTLVNYARAPRLAADDNPLSTALRHLHIAVRKCSSILSTAVKLVYDPRHGGSLERHAAKPNQQFRIESSICRPVCQGCLQTDYPDMTPAEWQECHASVFQGIAPPVSVDLSAPGRVNAMARWEDVLAIMPHDL